MAAIQITDGEIGVTIKRTIIDQDGVPVNLSGLTTKQFFLKNPNGVTSAALAATYPGGGSDGVVQYVLASGDINMPGGWEMQFSLSNGTASVLKTPLEKFEVGRKL